jgi:hypothetical protein
VISHTSPPFWTAFRDLPPTVQVAARKAYRRFRADPSHPSLQFKKLYDTRYSIRVTRGYRALGQREGDTIVWFWIGTHADYDRVIKSR